MFRHLFTQDFLIAPSFNGITSVSDKGILSLTLLLLAFGIFLSAITKKLKNPVQKNLWKRWQKLAYTISLLALVWVFFRYEGIPQISAHWLVILIYLIGLVWAVRIIRYVLKTYQPQKEAYDKEQLKKKYM
ncbi:MAG: hypothetical protein NVSMB66_3710 [Candidatus Doudnabacteria bacterium]